MLRRLGCEVGKKAKFVKGDLVSYMDDEGTMGIVVDSHQQLKLPFVYTIKWLINILMLKNILLLCLIKKRYHPKKRYPALLHQIKPLSLSNTIINIII